MKTIAFLLCVILCVSFGYSFFAMVKAKDAKMFVHTLVATIFNIAIILLFAILEKGRF